MCKLCCRKKWEKQRNKNTSIASATSSASNKLSFPCQLHEVLSLSDQAQHSELSSIMSWSPHGRSFLTHDRTKFTTEILPKYFSRTKFSSFQQQLNSHGFKRISNKTSSNSRDYDAYYHENLLRGRPDAAMGIARMSKNKADSDSNTDVQFYSMPFIGPNGIEGLNKIIMLLLRLP